MIFVFRDLVSSFVYDYECKRPEISLQRGEWEGRGGKGWAVLAFKTNFKVRDIAVLGLILWGSREVKSSLGMYLKLW